MNLDRIIAVRNDKTIYRDGDACIKVFDNEYSKADVLNEALNQARIESTQLNIPKIREVTTVDGKWVIVSDYIKGKTLAQIMQEDKVNKDKYIGMFVDIQLEIQNQTCPLLNRLKDKMNMKISETELPATTRFKLHNRLEEMPKQNKICHGDLNPSNVIVAEDGTTYIIDWSHATIGNGSADAARTYLLFCLQDDKEGAEKYLQIFCDKSNTEKEDIIRWMPIVAASQSVKGRLHEREFLLSCVSTLD